MRLADNYLATQDDGPVEFACTMPSGKTWPHHRVENRGARPGGAHSGPSPGVGDSTGGLGQRNASCPVSTLPSTSVCISSVPS